jgi:hypothetical protein
MPEPPYNRENIAWSRVDLRADVAATEKQEVSAPAENPLLVAQTSRM